MSASFTPATVGELISELQKLDPEMRLAHRDGLGFFMRGIELEQVELMRFAPEPHVAVLSNDPLWQKMKNRDFDMTFSALVVW